MPIPLGDLVQRIHAWIPPETALSYDNVGLQLGDPDQSISRGLIALDLTPAVIDEAIAADAEVIITHHPLLFHGLKRVTTNDFVGNMVLRLAKSGIALIAAHTNLDAAKDGVSDRLAALLGLTDRRFLVQSDSDMVKLVTFVPETHADVVRAAVLKAIALSIGPYTDLSFSSRGSGTFTPLADAKPFLGSAGGEIESVDEIRLEFPVAAKHVDLALSALHAAHPYETVVYDVYPVLQSSGRFGMGMVGHLGDAVDLSSFLSTVCTALKTPAVRYAGNPNASIKTVAVCGGSGGDLIGAAKAAGADAFVTADLKYHSFFDVLAADGSPPSMALIDAGHYETEAETEALLLEWLSSNIPAIGWHRTGHRTSPVSFHIPT